MIRDWMYCLYKPARSTMARLGWIWPGRGQLDARPAFVLVQVSETQRRDSHPSVVPTLATPDPPRDLLGTQPAAPNQTKEC